MEDNLSIKYWADDDKPREKLMLKGKIALSDAELLAILIGSGSRNESAVVLCQKILKSVDNNLNALGKLSINQLSEFKGIGEAKAISIIAALEIGRRRRAEDAADFTKLMSSKMVFDIMQPIIGELLHEEFWIIYLNNANKIITKSQISKGGLTGTIVDKRIIFKTAFENNAVAMVLVHNHPSGNLKPSPSDFENTEEIKNAGKLLQVQVLDHIIITENGYYSFADNDKM